MDVISDPVVKSFLLYGTTVLSKTMAMGVLTAITGLQKKIIARKEKKISLDGVVKGVDPDLARIRRCHVNDMENVYLFVLLGAFYCTTPSYSTAVWHFRIFTIARMWHTIFYLKQVPQPARGLAFAVGVSVCISMAYRIIGTVRR